LCVSELLEEGPKVTPIEDREEVQDVLKILENDRDECHQEFDVPEDDSGGSGSDEPVRKKKKPGNMATRQKWSSEEVDELRELFEEDFRTNTLPGQKRIEAKMKKSKEGSGVIYQRKRDNIKKKLSNMMIKRRRGLVQD